MDVKELQQVQPYTLLRSSWDCILGRNCSFIAGWHAVLPKGKGKSKGKVFLEEICPYV